MSAIRVPVTLTRVALVAALAAAGGFALYDKPTEPRKPSPTLFAKVAPPLGTDDPAPPVIPGQLALKQRLTVNLTAFVPPQCYTKTTDARGKVHNPCYTCHVGSRAPNFINDGDVQLAYSFVPRARKNPWKNLLIDWTSRLSEIADEEILRYVRTSNYFDETGGIVLAQRLGSPPPEWDHGSDGKWSGFVPDVRYRFDERGFDRLPDGGYTGWRAFAYYPLPGTFFPTNGSMGDVLIRLPEAFRSDASGRFNLAIYETNLAAVEALVTRKSDKGHTPSYAGKAKAELEAGRVHLAEGLYPEGTEFFHTVRYLDPTPSGIRMSARLKELRYAKKTDWVPVKELERRAKAEAIAKVDSPAELRNFGGDIERGVSNNQGWFFQGFIEDKDGALRPQSFEENVYCTGCHDGVGATDDGIFSYSRRLGQSAFQAGFFHATQRGLEGVPDRPIHGGSSTEYVTYLELNGAGDEFRQNEEVIARFFDGEGKLVPRMKKALRTDVTVLLMPSEERALALDKAYRLLVREQSFPNGRELVVNGAREVHQSVTADQKTGITEQVEPPWSSSRLASAAIE